MPQKAKYNLPDIDDSFNIGEKVALIRKKHGLSQMELANKIGISQGLLSHYENGRLNMPVEVLAQLSITLKIDSNVILGIKKDNINKAETDLKITSRIIKIQNLPTSKKRAIFEMIDAYLSANEK